MPQIESIKRRREARKASGLRLPSITKQPSRQATGKILEVQYFRIIKNLIEPYFEDMRERFIPALPAIVEQFQRETRVDANRQDAYGKEITRRIRDILLGIAIKISVPRIKVRAEDQANNISRFNRKQFDRQITTVLGVNPILNEPYLTSQVDAFVERNAALIKDVPEQSLRRVETKLRTGIERGESLAKITETVQIELRVAKNRAKLIARDQTNKFMGKLTELRQTELGVEEYIWSDSRDRRVRGNPAGKYPNAEPSHHHRNGKKFKWNDPPSGGHPGEAIQCRCAALPILEDFKPGRNIKTTSRADTALVGAAIAARTIKQALEKVEL